jgi:hypothetical protein
VDGQVVGFAYQDGRSGKAGEDKPDRVLVQKPDGSQVLLPMDKFALTCGPWADAFREACLPASVPCFHIRGMKEIHVRSHAQPLRRLTSWQQVYRPKVPLSIPPTLMFSYITPSKHKETDKTKARLSRFSPDWYGCLAHPEIYIRPDGGLPILTNERSSSGFPGDIYALLDE